MARGQAADQTHRVESAVCGNAWPARGRIRQLCLLVEPSLEWIQCTLLLEDRTTTSHASNVTAIKPIIKHNSKAKIDKAENCITEAPCSLTPNCKSQKPEVLHDTFPFQRRILTQANWAPYVIARPPNGPGKCHLAQIHISYCGLLVR